MRAETLFALILVAGQFLELVVLYVRPALLAPFAVLHAGKARSVEIPPAAREAITTMSDAGAGYRVAAERTMDLARLPGPDKVEDGQRTMLISRDPPRVLVRKKWNLSRRQRPLLRVDLEVRGERIVLRPRFYPTAALSLIAALVVACAVCATAWPVIVALVALSIVVAFSLLEARGHIDSAHREILSRVRQLVPEAPAKSAHATARVRVEPEQGALAEASEPSEPARGARSAR